MEELVKLFARGISAAADASAAKDAEAEAAALAELDAVIAEVHPAAAGLRAGIEANRAEALAALKDKFKTDDTKPE